MPYTRKNVWELGGDWADTILWYARGVAAMKARALAEPTSWNFYGAIHGIDTDLWGQFGYLSPSTPMPSSALQNTFWNQCQHGSWYFLPWHRGYLLAFEANVRAEVIKLGGPADWALPYWNYFKSGQSALPPAFASANWPDGQGNNPLFVPQRYGPNNDGKVFVPLNEVNLKALKDPTFTGVASGGSPGFGGVDTGFMHGGQVHGGIETQPHDWVHGLVGGGDPQNPDIPGLMSDPDTAALDPIFWLHHANIDRLWQVWRQNPSSHINPPAPNWIKGPANIGERVFAMPMPDGSTWNYAPGDMVDLGKLEYGYDDLSPAVAVPSPSSRIRALAGPAPEAQGAPIVETGKNVELVGATQQPLPVQDGEVSATVHLDSAGRRKVSASLAKAAETNAPDRVFLNLENVRGVSDSTAFHVYVGLPAGVDPAAHPELLAGSVALFGVRKASKPDGEHGGQGLTFVLEITDIVDNLHLNNALDVDTLDVRLVPVKPIPPSAQITIGRISIYRQGL
jgi:tyrosinase